MFFLFVLSTQSLANQLIFKLYELWGVGGVKIKYTSIVVDQHRRYISNRKLTSKIIKYHKLLFRKVV